MSILLNGEMELRAGWRFGLYAAVLAAMVFANGALLSILLPGRAGTGELAVLGINAISLGVPSIVALIFMIRFVEQVPVLTFGVGFHERWLRDLGLGAVIALAMLGVYGLGTGLLGVIRVEPEAEGAAFFTRIGALTLILLVSAANEELIFRGYPLQVLMAGIGPWPAMIIMSGAFGLGHHLNPNATLLGTANTFLAGILLCLAYVRTRSLWFPYGIHIGWNLGLGPIFGFPLSGLNLSSVWNTEIGGAGWITGGAYGPEGGILFTGVMSGAIFVVVFTRLVAVSPSLSTLLTRYSGKVYRDSTLSSPGGS